MHPLSTSAILSVFWAHFCGKFQVFWYIHFRKISRNMSIFHYREGYIFNQVITLLSETSSNLLKWIKYCEKVWSTFVDQMVLFKKKHISFDSCLLTWRIGYVLYVHCPIQHLVGRSFIFENIIKYSARSHPRVPKNFPDPKCVCFWPWFFSRFSFYFFKQTKICIIFIIKSPQKTWRKWYLSRNLEKLMRNRARTIARAHLSMLQIEKW